MNRCAARGRSDKRSNLFGDEFRSPDPAAVTARAAGNARLKRTRPDYFTSREQKTIPRRHWVKPWRRTLAATESQIQSRFVEDYQAPRSPDRRCIVPAQWRKPFLSPARPDGVVEEPSGQNGF